MAVSFPLRLALGLMISCGAGTAFCADTQEVLRQFSSEVHLHESQQVLRTGKPLRYADGEAGAAMQKIMESARATQVLDALDEAIRRGESAPDALQTMKPLADRYKQACEQWLDDYENECLDIMNWGVQAVTRNVARMSASPPPGPGTDAGAGQLLAAARTFTIGLTGLMERAIREKVANGAFSAPGRERALAMAGELTAARSLLVTTRMRPVYSGREAYEQACVVCHKPGVANAPRLGDRAAWQRRAAAGLDALVQSTLRGKGAMPPRGGSSELQDVELARATAYLANSGGASFAEPELPKEHSGMVVVEEPRRVEPSPPARAANTRDAGERVYAINCQACHMQGQQTGPIAALRGAKSLQNKDTAVRIILHGNRFMPSWRQLSDQDIADVTNYVVAQFAAKALAPVAVEDVRRLR